MGIWKDEGEARRRLLLWRGRSSAGGEDMGEKWHFEGSEGCFWTMVMNRWVTEGDLFTPQHPASEAHGGFVISPKDVFDM